MRLIDADGLKEKAETVTLWNGDVRRFVSYETIDNAPTVPLPDFKAGYRQAVLDGKTNYSRTKGEWIESDVPESILSKCSVCGFHCGAWTFNYCPMCAADMRGKKEADND